MEEKTKKRICPVCDTYTDGDKCPKDGAPTFEPPEEGKEKGEFKNGDIFDGKYRIEEVIGTGGMGIVYKAIQLSMSREVALKVLSKELGEDLNQIKRFYREGMSASKLSHPNTIKVYDFGCTKERCLYMAMEFLRGEPLALVLSKEKLSLKRILKISIQILKSLAEAHKVGIVHRDLKPQNIFLNEIYGEEDFVKVLDFGIAKLHVKDTGESSLTKTGTLLGTAQYMSPEQAKGIRVDHRSDIYSYGVILFEMLAGYRPFDGQTPVEILMKHTINPPPKIKESAGGEKIPEKILDVLYKCLEKEREKRPSSCEEIILLFEDMFYEMVIENKKEKEEKKIEKKEIPEEKRLLVTPEDIFKKEEEEEHKLTEFMLVPEKRSKKIFYIIPAFIFIIIIAGGILFFLKEGKEEKIGGVKNINELDVIEQKVLIEKDILEGEELKIIEEIEEKDVPAEEEVLIEKEIIIKKIEKKKLKPLKKKEEKKYEKW